MLTSLHAYLGSSFVQTATRISGSEIKLDGLGRRRPSERPCDHGRTLITLDATSNATAGFASAKWLRDGGRRQLAASANEELRQVTRRQVV